MKAGKRAPAAQAPTAQPPGIKAGAGRHIFNLATLNKVEAGPGYSTAAGALVEGERIRRTASPGPPWGMLPPGRTTSPDTGQEPVTGDS